MTESDEQDERISLIFGGKIPSVGEESLSLYLAYLKEHLELPCELTGIEDFEWEEYYVLGPGDRKEYEGRKKTMPSYSDKYQLISLADEVDDWMGILVQVKRVSDKKKFTLPLSDMEATEEGSKNYQLLDDYSVWFVNNR
ncbi:MAG: hypothetical protein E3K40_10285 [Candidatus Brocadia sp.]|nr:hypothetical protein [Candidatus Brocadia sp.]MDG6027071.1 hypothetical protein [Candidatus Brocadia sp.]